MCLSLFFLLGLSALPRLCCNCSDTTKLDDYYNSVSMAQSMDGLSALPRLCCNCSDTTKLDDYYNSVSMAQSMDLKMLHGDLQPGQKKQRPLLHVPIDQTTTDELHHLLRM